MPLTLNSSGVKTGRMKVDGTIEKKKVFSKTKKTKHWLRFDVLNRRRFIYRFLYWTLVILRWLYFSDDFNVSSIKPAKDSKGSRVK